MAWTHCTTCGTEINDNERVCGSCGSPQPARLKDATLLQRFVGALIDSISQGALLVPVFIMRMGGMQSMLRTLVQQRGVLMMRLTIESFVLTEVIFLLLNGYFLTRNGQTIGKLAMGTRIVGMDGNIPAFGRIFGLRYFLMTLLRQVPFFGGILGLLDALFIFGKDRRYLHDYLAETRVIEA